MKHHAFVLFVCGLFISLMLSCEVAFYPYYLRRNRLNVTFVLDVSGSMGTDQISGMKEAVRIALGRLNENDLMAIVTFDSAAYVVLEPEYVTDRSSLESIIDALPVTGGGTDIYAGMTEGYIQVAKNYSEDLVNSIILLSDGASSGEMVRLAAEKRDQGITVSAIALGDGADTALLESIAVSGDGTYYWIGDPANIGQAFQDEIDSLLVPVKKNRMLYQSEVFRGAVGRSKGGRPRGKMHFVNL